MEYYTFWKPTENEIKNFREEWLLGFAHEEITLEQAHQAATLCIGECDYVPRISRFKNKIIDIKGKEPREPTNLKTGTEKPWEVRREVGLKHLANITNTLKEKGLWNVRKQNGAIANGC